MKIVQCKCPACGASLDIKSDKKFAFCEYCGEKFYIDDEAQTIVFRDEARLKEAENRAREMDAAEKREAIRQSKIEEQQQAYKEAYQKWKHWVPTPIAIGALCWFSMMMIISYASINQVIRNFAQLLMLVPFGISAYAGYKMPIDTPNENRKHPKIAFGVLIFGIAWIIAMVAWKLISSIIG